MTREKGDIFVWVETGRFLVPTIPGRCFFFEAAYRSVQLSYVDFQLGQNATAVLLGQESAEQERMRTSETLEQMTDRTTPRARSRVGRR